MNKNFTAALHTYIFYEFTDCLSLLRASAGYRMTDRFQEALFVRFCPACLILAPPSSATLLHLPTCQAERISTFHQNTMLSVSQLKDVCAAFVSTFWKALHQPSAFVVCCVHCSHWVYYKSYCSLTAGD